VVLTLWRSGDAGTAASGDNGMHAVVEAAVLENRVVKLWQREAALSERHAAHRSACFGPHTRSHVVNRHKRRRSGNTALRLWRRESGDRVRQTAWSPKLYASRFSVRSRS